MNHATPGAMPPFPLLHWWALPLLALLAGATLTGWLLSGATLPVAAAHTFGVLLVAAPCVLPLALPAVQAAAVRAAARHGIVARDANTLLAVRAVTVAVFEHATLAAREQQLADAVGAGISRQALLQLAATLVQAADTPHWRALQHSATDSHSAPLALAGRAALPGEGWAGTIAGQRYAIGDSRLLTDYGLTPGTLADAAAQAEAQGLRLFWLLRLAPQPQPLGLLTFGETLAPQAAAALAALSALDVRPLLQSATAHGSTRQLARRLGIMSFRSQVAADGQASLIRRLRQSGEVVATLRRCQQWLLVDCERRDGRPASRLSIPAHQPERLADAIALARRLHGFGRTLHRTLLAYGVLAVPLAVLGCLTLAGAALAAASVLAAAGAAALLLCRPTRAVPAPPPRHNWLRF